MREVVAKVNGKEITRTKGHKFPFYVNGKVVNGVTVMEYTFKTKKAAIAFCESL